MTRETGPVGNKGAISHQGIARTYLGILKKRMKLSGISSLRWRRILADGTKIIVSSINGQDFIKVIPIIKEAIAESIGNIFLIPRSDTAPNGWGAPITEDNSPLGTIGGTPEGVVISKRGTEITRAAETSLPYTVDWVNSAKTHQLMWKASHAHIPTDEAPLDSRNRYNCVPNGVSIYKKNETLASLPLKIVGACMTLIDGVEYLIAITMTPLSGDSVTFEAFRRVFREEYSNDNVFDAETESDGWEAFGDSGSLTFLADPAEPDVYGLTIRSGVYFSGNGKEGGAAAWAWDHVSFFENAYPVGEFVFKVTSSGVVITFEEKIGFIFTKTFTEESTIVNSGGIETGLYQSSTVNDIAEAVVIGVDYRSSEKIYLKYTANGTSTETHNYVGPSIGFPAIDRELIKATYGSTTRTFQLGDLAFTSTETFVEQETTTYTVATLLTELVSLSTTKGITSLLLLYADLRYKIALLQTLTSDQRIEGSGSSVVDLIYNTTSEDAIKHVFEPSKISLNAATTTFSASNNQGLIGGVPLPTPAVPLTVTVTTELANGLWSLNFSPTFPDDSIGTNSTPAVIEGVSDADGSTLLLFAKQIPPISFDISAGGLGPPYLDPIEQIGYYVPWGFDVYDRLEMVGTTPRWTDLKLI